MVYNSNEKGRRRYLKFGPSTGDKKPKEMKRAPKRISAFEKVTQENDHADLERRVMDEVHARVSSATDAAATDAGLAAAIEKTRMVAPDLDAGDATKTYFKGQEPAESILETPQTSVSIPDTLKAKIGQTVASIGFERHSPVHVPIMQKKQRKDDGVLINTDYPAPQFPLGFDFRGSTAGLVASAQAVKDAMRMQARTAALVSESKRKMADSREAEGITGFI